MNKRQNVRTSDTAVYTNICSVDQCYEPPCIEVIEVSVEKGFADSATDFGEGAW